MKNKFLLLSSLFFLIFTVSCTDLEERLFSEIPGEDFVGDSFDGDAVLNGVYRGLELPFQDQSRFWAAQEHTSDEAMGPTRGTDWDDNGIWRVLHNHTWDANHLFLNNTFKELLQQVYNASDVLANDATDAQKLEARFLRAFLMLQVVDGWGQVPFREPGSDIAELPRVMQADEAITFVIDELEAIRGSLPDGPAHKANRHAANGILMRAYLNKGAYTNRENPTFDGGDMDKVISLADEITATGNFELTNYFDNFVRNNADLSKELIFTAQNIGGSIGGNVQSRWYCGLHYNQSPSGWNGFCTIADLYDKFEADDPRAFTEIPELKDNSGLNAGFLVGQQFDKDGNELEDRRGNKLSYTKEVALLEKGDNLEVTGIRVMKYVPDLETEFPSENDYVYLRYSDVLLMKAEAQLRNGGSAKEIVNEIRTFRGVGALDNVGLDELLDERARELYWEGMRRTDLIRFGKYLDAWHEKPASGTERLLFPIPNPQLAINPNFTQNPGY